MSLHKRITILNALVILMAIGLAAGCLSRNSSTVPDEESSSEARKERLMEMTPEIREVVKANSDFAFDLYARLAKDKRGENLFFSPYSLSSALTMAAEGASSETAEEMGKVLRYPDSARRKGDDRTLPWDMSRIHTGMAALNDHFAGGGRSAPRAIRVKLETLRQQLKDANEKTKKLGHSGQFAEYEAAHKNAEQLAAEINQLQVRYDQYELRIANALWGEKTYAFRQAYFDALDKHYHGGSFFPVDFKNDFEGARQHINAWVEKQTHNRIKDILPPNVLDEEAKKLVRLILTNAIYFKGEWAEIFRTEATKDDDFLLPDGKKERVPMMAHPYMKSARYAAFRGDGTLFDTPARIRIGENDAKKLYPDDSGFQMLELPYKGGEVSMILTVQRGFPDSR